jgi:serine/threonine protein phosphatase PrpC
MSVLQDPDDEGTVPAFRWSSAALTDVGRVRSVNEDACLELLLPQSGVWVVADGMGGHHSGDVASRTVVDALRGVRWHARIDELVQDVTTRLEGANRRLVDMAEASHSPVAIGTTVAVLVALRRQGVCLWAGDSRVYRLREGRLDRLTRDHSEVEDLVERGEILPEEVASHPAANVITRAVGADAALELDCVRQDLRSGDRYLLCTDGLYKEVSEAEMRELVGKGSCEHASRALLDLALARGSRDNVTVIVTQFQEAS